MPLQIAGGIGLFLLGMILMTDGIKQVAGNSLRQALMRFTGRPLHAFASGVVVTMVIQSSSATTLTVIGFVSAGLLSFSQSVSVVIGASLGTTGTSWLVAVLGLKFSLGSYALPLVVVGALLRLLASGVWRGLGLPLAGFGLIFVGIDTLQQGMSGIADRVSIADWAGDTWWTLVLMVLVGVALTVITQSSSAAMATILTALHTESITFEQAAALVIGAAIGTTVTSVLASIGANVSARRTALAHVIFNLASGVLAVLLFPLFLKGITWAQIHLGVPPGAISLTLFHTAFIGLGALLFMPLVGPFARWIERLIPESESPLTRNLDKSVLNVPEVALEVSRRALGDTAAELFDAARRRLTWGNRGYHDSGLQQSRIAIRRIRDFLARVQHLPNDRPMAQSHIAQIHAIDHLLRLEQSLEPPRAQVEYLSDPRMAEALSQTTELLRLAATGLRGERDEQWPEAVRHYALQLASIRRQDRPRMMQATALGDWDPELALALLDTMRWLDRLGYHTWRICHHLTGGQDDGGGRDEELETAQADMASQAADALDEPVMIH
ncbi:MAG: Na/Pi cotransporter family protein [Planctomycetaceae bacterium]|nr:MAG: Na/Pi cotransporter family protein [Planctomycetaceae bacterium]